MRRDLFSVEPDYPHGEVPAVGVLLVQLGTPQAPTPQAVRPYLKQFLSDPRVIELPRLLWWLILNCFVLTTRPRASAELYANIWTDEGSPLLVICRRIADAVSRRLRDEIGTPTRVALGMTYGEPSIARALRELRAASCRRVLIFPLYSRYSSSGTGAAFDAVMRELTTWRCVPEIRTLQGYCDEPAYIHALAASVRELWSKEGEPELLLTSYHGIPKRYFENGDPYHCHCHKTSRLLAEELSLAEDRYQVSFQSRLGREEWLTPYTDVRLEELARSGVREVDVICPGFSVDCLETLDEIGREAREAFLAAGGERFRFIPCLNDRPEQIDLYVDLIRRNLGGWVESKDDWDAERARSAAAESRALAEAMIAQTRPGPPRRGEDEPLGYSLRSATTGSTRVARRAGR